MREFIFNSWNMIMDDRRNPLSNIPDMQTRHVVMQLLAWMWCIIFSISIGSMTVFGVSALAHSLFIGGLIFTIATFETDEASGEVDMNASDNKFLGQYTTPRVAISGIEKPYHELTFNEKRRLGRMIEQKIAKSNLQILNAL